MRRGWINDEVRRMGRVIYEPKTKGEEMRIHRIAARLRKKHKEIVERAKARGGSGFAKFTKGEDQQVDALRMLNRIVHSEGPDAFMRLIKTEKRK